MVGCCFVYTGGTVARGSSHHQVGSDESVRRLASINRGRIAPARCSSYFLPDANCFHNAVFFLALCFTVNVWCDKARRGGDDPASFVAWPVDRAIAMGLISGRGRVVCTCWEGSRDRSPRREMNQKAGSTSVATFELALLPVPTKFLSSSS